MSFLKVAPIGESSPTLSLKHSDETDNLVWERLAYDLAGDACPDNPNAAREFVFAHVPGLREEFLAAFDKSSFLKDLAARHLDDGREMR